MLAMLAVAASVGCAMNIDESTVFQPQARGVPAQSAAELERWPHDAIAAQFSDIDVRHGFIGDGEERTAFTLIRRHGEARPLIVNCFGNAGDRNASGVHYARKALPYGDVLLFDYPGYGDSPGAPSAESMDAMAQRVSDFSAILADGRKLVFWGHSLGGFVCSRMAGVTAGADAVVLEATARNAAEVASAWTPWYAAPFVRVNIADGLAKYDSADALRHFEGPILVLGATRDSTLPVGLSRSLAAALTNAGDRVTYVEFPAAGHSNINSQPEFADAMSAFFSGLQVQP